MIFDNLPEDFETHDSMQCVSELCVDTHSFLHLMFKSQKNDNAIRCEAPTETAQTHALPPEAVELNISGLQQNTGKDCADFNYICPAWRIATVHPVGTSFFQ